MNALTIAFDKDFIINAGDAQVDNRIAVSTFQSHLMQYRYMLSEEAFFALAKCDLSYIAVVNNDIIEHLKKKVGGTKKYTPLYQNFPAEVMSATDYELFINALRHYWSNGFWSPISVEMERPVAFEKIKYNIVEIKTDRELYQIFTDLVSINQSLTPEDLKVVKWFAENGASVLSSFMPPVIPFKENLCALAAMGLPVPVKTPTDVLRIAVHMSGGDISLPAVPSATMKTRNGGRFSRGYTTVSNPLRETFKFKKFSRKERRMLLGLLEQTHCDPKEMILKDQRWVRLGEILHPGEFQQSYPKTAHAFQSIRNEKVKSWYSLYTNALNTSLEAGLNILSQRPGEFARRIDYLVRTYPKQVDLILTYFKQAIQGTSNKVLFEVYTHFENRNSDKPRAISIKGSRRKIELPTLKGLPQSLIDSIHSQLFSGLKDKFSQLEPLGNCLIDPELKMIPLPTNMRSLNPSAKPIIRGQHTKWDNPESKVIRAYFHWTDDRGNTDPDLSATFISEKKKDATVLSFSNLRTLGSCHSGDIRHRRGNNAEYVDINVADALNAGYKYVILDVRNYNGGSLKSINGTFGTMEREFPQSGTTWLPETITNAVQCMSESSNTLLAMLDLENKSYVFLDVDSNGTTFATGDVKNIMKIVEQYAKPPKVSVYDLALMHAESRGRIVNIDQPFDTHFKYDDFINSYEKTAKLMGV